MGLMFKDLKVHAHHKVYGKQATVGVLESVNDNIYAFYLGKKSLTVMGAIGQQTYNFQGKSVGNENYVPPNIPLEQKLHLILNYIKPSVVS